MKNKIKGRRTTPTGTSSSGSNMFLYGFVLSFMALGIFNIMHHEMWRDELEAWMMARDASTIGELFNNIRYQGHPALWFLSLYVLARITPDPLIMQCFHLALAVGVVYVVLRYAPFTKFQRVLFIFGYYPFYEYCVISRNYSYGLLLLLIFLSMFRNKKGIRNYIGLSIVLFLLCQSNPYGAVIAIALALLLIFDFIFLREDATPVSPQMKWKFAAGIFIFICGLLISAMQMRPPRDSVWFHPTFIHDNKLLMLTKFLEAVGCIWRAYIPVPPFKQHFWGHNFINYFFDNPINTVKATVFLSIVLGGLSLMFFLRRRAALFYYFTGTLGITLFSYAIYGGSIRHWGHYFIVFVSAVWISNLYEEKPFKFSPLNKITIFFEGEKTAFFTFVLFVNVVAGVAANTLDYLYPFSSNKEAATYIKANGLDKMPILGDQDFSASGVAAYLNRPVYYPATGRHATFIRWDNNRRAFDGSTIIKEAELYSSHEKQDILLVLNYQITPAAFTPYNIQPVAAFTGSVLYAERFYLYIMKYVPRRL
ncbi:hypothetical protein [Candidatus Magnetominusculus xianensis]|uniref:Glycosyltransferase RgtA/B/C/D-like domain-containing protein n=1 Tax=Candidatus Magnetominusculus xianensis TaxID=1748249 RepID=A0ABR5SG26_9BACT|nr:hypothetical protein [Candidatus Magnetominusculus xianensis]KWT87087.1 hypothetical protein ASN18_1376 [Candidatus Magnetominusculus xianensis]MBF0404989.1 hypothetical protein [Nitrospirota bacterium]